MGIVTPTASLAAEAQAAPSPWWQRLDRSVLVMVAITVVAFGLRIYDINWDQNQHLHPDERQIVFVASCLGLHNVQPGCTPVPDPANPHFFAYGSFPMYVLALVTNGLLHLFPHIINAAAAYPSYYSPVQDLFTLVGRTLSALFDTGTVVVTGLIARRLLGRWWGVVAAALVAFSTIDIQLSHYYAVDTVLTFFITLALLGTIGLALHRPSERTAAALAAGGLPRLGETLAWAALTGLAAGLAIASKVSAAPIALPIAVALLLRWRRLGLGGWPDIVLAGITTTVTALLAFMITMPYAILDSVQFWHDVNEQNSLARGVIVYPYTIQFANRTPYLDQLKNLFIWDLGVCFMIAAVAGIGVAIFRLWRRWDDPLLILLAWVLVYFGITGSFYMKFPRYQLPIVPALAVLATVTLAAICRVAAAPVAGQPSPAWRRPLDGARQALTTRFGQIWPRRLAQGLAVVTIAGGLVLSLSYLSIYHDPMTRLAASDWMYAHVAPGSTISHEIWDDSLPLPRGANSPSRYQFTDLGLYDADTSTKADTLSTQLASIDYVVLASNRLYGSITRVPYMYPMTAHYYQLLFNGQLGFHLVKTFANSPHLGPFSLPDSTADESYSVYDHPTVWIFARDAGQPLDAATIKSRLLDGISLPSASAALASQKPLLLSANDIAADNQNAPLWQRFNPSSWQSQLALPLWWLTIEILGLLAFPIAFVALPGLKDRGWGLAKALGILGLSYLIWMPASLGVVPYEERTVWLAALVLAAIGGAIAWFQRRKLRAFFRQHWRLIVLTEAVTLAAFLAFVAIRSSDPDLWHIWRGGEKPMELTFLNGILRSRTLPPLDPWFAGSYINYYYFGQFLVATLIELTGIVPTTAFNLAIPMLFALTFSGALSVIGGITGRWWVGLLGGWAVAVAGNLDGLRQWWQQFQALQSHAAAIPFDYWQSSRVIPFTINEFPFWSFLYADLHAHVIDLPIVLLGLGIAASLLALPPDAPRWSRYVALGVAALALGAMACINTWDMPTYGGVIVLALLIAEIRALPRHLDLAKVVAPPPGPAPSTPAILAFAVRAPIAGVLRYFNLNDQAQRVLGDNPIGHYLGGRLRAWWSALPKPVITWADVRNVALSILGVVGGAFVLYLPFYTHFQSLYGQIGPVTVATDPILFLTLFGLWLFLIATFFTLEVFDRWGQRVARRQEQGQFVLASDPVQRALALCVALLAVMTFLVVKGVKPLLIGLLVWGLVLALTRPMRPAQQFAYLVILVGLGVALAVELVYLRDFLDGGDWRRMNTVFKFYYQVWLLFGLGGAIALGQIIQRFALAARAIGAPAPQPAAQAAAEPALLGQGGATLAFAASGQMGDTGPLPTGSVFPMPESTADDASQTESLRWRVSDIPPAAVRESFGGGDQVVGWGLRGLWLVVLAALIFGSSIFLFEGTAARVNDRALWVQVQPPPGPVPSLPSLDGFAYMGAWYPGDAAAITWMNEHISGAPVILEASSDPYQWFGRVGIYTGLPSVLGWANHESQQRYPSEVFARSPDVTLAYSSDNAAQVQTILQKYHVRYIYVGQLECVFYALHDQNPTSPSAASVQQCNAAHSLLGPLTVFPSMVDQGTLRVAYSNAQVTLFEVVGG